MSEKLYALLLKLYPEHFRRTYGDEALRLVRDRARDEKGFLLRLRLWLDLLADLAISLPGEYSKAPATPMAEAQRFQLLAERWLNPAPLFLGGMVSAVLFCSCVAAVAHSRTFPALYQDSHSLQAFVQSSLDLARSRSAVPVDAYSFCMTARRDIPKNSVQPLFTFDFAPPGASGVALIDGKLVEAFRNEQHVLIRADLIAGDHQLEVQLDGPAEITSTSGGDDFQYCSPK